jgi:hypothetical protein
MNDIGWYYIYSNDYDFAVLETIHSTLEHAWNKANDIAERLDGIIEHFDVMGPFETKKMMLKDIISRANENVEAFRMPPAHD